MLRDYFENSNYIHKRSVESTDYIYQDGFEKRMEKREAFL